jgi:hypothetical protein
MVQKRASCGAVAPLREGRRLVKHGSDSVKHGRWRWLVAVAGLGLALPGTASAEVPIFPEMAVQGNGRAHFAWNWSDGAAEGVQERWRTAAGSFSETQWATPARQGAELAGIATDAAGDAAIVWQETTPGSGFDRIRLRWREADGTVRPVQTLSTLGADTFGPDVAVDPAGNAYVTWVEVASGGVTGVVRVRRRAADGTLGPTETVSPASGVQPRATRIVADKAGNAIVAWEGLSSGVISVRTRRRDVSTGQWSASQRLSYLDGNAYGLDLAVDEDGNATYAWLFDPGTSSGIHVRRRKVDGTLSAIQAISGQVADSEAGRLFESPRVAVTPTGAATVSWTRLDSGGNRAVEARRRRPDGYLSAIATMTDPGVNAFAPRIATDAGGNATVVWAAYNGEGGYGAYARRRSISGTLGPVHSLAPLPVDVLGTTVGVDGTGNALVAWTGFVEGSGRRIQVRRVAPNGTEGPTETIAP